MPFRRSSRLLTLALVTLSTLVLPTVPSSGDAPASSTADRTIELRDGQATELAVDDLVAVSADLHGRAVEVRWADDSADGWSDWTPLAASGEHAPDEDSAELDGVDTGISEPVWTGRTDTLQVRGDAGELDLELITMAGDLARRADDTPPATAEAFSVWPPIVPRSAWDPNGDCEAKGSADIAPTVERIFVHHTVVFPDYAPPEGDDVVRAICLGHTKRRGFDDIGYNFLIDRYGVIYQGREGGILNAVEGAHAQGFNYGSAGIALVGNFQEDHVPAAAAEALDALSAWLTDLHGIAPKGRGMMTSTGGKSTRYPEGFVVDLPNIVGHRDTALNSSCPGDHLYDIVRGTHPIAPRVHARLVADYGWPLEGLPEHHQHEPDVSVAVAPGNETVPAPDPGTPPAPQVPAPATDAARPVEVLVGRVLDVARTTARIALGAR